MEQEGPSNNDKESNKKEEKVIIEADDAAIDAALKKHWEHEKSFVEADEQTIIDKVLNQKKKGKWDKKY
jgi:ligand-binding SRPBCC domain-containing protein